MPHIARDLVEVSTTSTGTGNLTLGAALAGRQSLDAAGFATGDRMTYRVANEAGTAWEIGVGTLTKSGATWTLARNIVQSSSSGGAKINFTAGTKHVACVVSAACGVLVGLEFDSVPPSVISGGIAAGRGATANNGGVAFGSGAEAAAYAVALGRLAKATGQGSVALGDNAQAVGSSSVACPGARAQGEMSFAFPGARTEKSAVVAQGGYDFARLSWVGQTYSGNGWTDTLQDSNSSRLRLPGTAGVALLEIDVIGASDTDVYAAKVSAVVRYGSGVALDGAPVVAVTRDTTGGEASITIKTGPSAGDTIEVTVSSGSFDNFRWVGRIGAVVSYNS
ncbi:hypothetical protein [Thauera sp.]|uniref:hypothetical protein n=1 Tax=Thauera sp. TaxID=1905334 RepID=UPI0039E64AE6